MIEALFFALLAGGAIPLGGFLARVEKLSPGWLEEEFHHAVISFGGGALLSAVALVLVPEGCSHLTGPPSVEGAHPSLAVASFLAGGFAFFGLDCLLARFRGSAAQLVAMLSDFIPEAIALGAGFAMGDSSGPLLAFMIGIQNLPEGFNAYRELKESGNISSRKVLITFVLLSFIGPLAAFLGIRFFANHPALLGSLMLFAGGGILYLTFEDIAPQAVLKNQRRPALGSVLGFTLGLVGYLLTGG